MENRRIAPRKRVLKAGIIDVGGSISVQCNVKNISETGIMIEVKTPMFIPDKFRLIVQSERLDRLCQTVWRASGRMGVTFQ